MGLHRREHASPSLAVSQPSSSPQLPARSRDRMGAAQARTVCSSSSSTAGSHTQARRAGPHSPMPSTVPAALSGQRGHHCLPPPGLLPLKSTDVNVPWASHQSTPSLARQTRSGHSVRRFRKRTKGQRGLTQTREPLTGSAASPAAPTPWAPSFTMRPAVFRLLSAERDQEARHTFSPSYVAGPTQVIDSAEATPLFLPTRPDARPSSPTDR